MDTPDELLARILDAAARITKGEDQLRRATRDLRTRVAKCIEVDGGIFENLLWTVTIFLISVQQIFYLNLTLKLKIKLTVINFSDFTFMWQCIVTNYFIIKPIRCTNFSNLFWHEILHVSGSSSAHRQEFIHCILGTGTYRTGLKTAVEQDQDVPYWSCSAAVYKPVRHIPLLSVQWINSWWWTDELSETCSVSCQNKFVKLVHLVGFIIK